MAGLSPNDSGNVSGIAKSGEVYNKAEIDNKLDSKADSVSTYSKDETDTLLGDKVNTTAFNESVIRIDELENEVSELRLELEGKGVIEVFNGSLIANGSNTVTLPVNYLDYDAVTVYGNLSSTPGYIYRMGATLPLLELESNILLGQFVSPGVGSSGLTLSRSGETLTFGTIKSGGSTGDGIIAYIALIKY